MSYVPIDAAKHRSSRSRVPGLRAGHSFMWSRPLPDWLITRCDQLNSICGEISGVGKPLLFVLSATEARKSSCFRRPSSRPFVLLATGIRAFGDQSSCFRRPIGKASDRLIRGPNSNPDQALGRSGLGVILTRPAPAFRRERPFTVKVGVSTKSNVKPGMVLSSAMRFNSYRKCLSEL